MNNIVEVVPYLITRTSTQKKVLLESNNLQNKKKSLDLIFKLCRDSLFLNAIIFSTDYLYESIGKYLPNDVNLINKKGRQTIKSILNLYSRSAFDCTPFNTFTEISVSELNENMGSIFSPCKEKEYTLKSEINLYLIRYILDSISANVEKFENVEIEVNSSVWLNKNSLSFLSPKQKQIAINSISNTKEIQEIVLFINKNGALKFNELLLFCIDNYDEDKESVINFLKELINLGLIRIRKEFNVLEKNRLNNTIIFLESIKDETNFLECLINPLVKLENLISNLSLNSNLDIINKELKIINHEIELYYKKHSQIADDYYPFKHYNLVFQDLINKSVNHFNRNTANILAKTLEDYIRKLDFPSLDQLDLNSFHDFYLKKFNNKEKTSLLEFYLAYFNSDEMKSDFKLNLKKVYELKMDMVHLLKKTLEIKIQESYSMGIIHVKLEDLACLNINKKSNITAQTISQSVYFSIKGKESLISMFLSGHGRAESRFLQFFDESVKDAYRDMNTKHYLGSRTMEFSDFSFFNANLHSQLCEIELDLKQNHTYFKDVQKISLDKLFIRIKNNSIQLVDNENNLISPLNVFLEETREKSFLYKFLNKFTPSREIKINLLIDTINNLIEKDTIDKQVVFFPKIILDNNIVIAMKHWRVLIMGFKNLFDNKNIKERLLKRYFNDWGIPLMGYIQYGDDELITKPYFIDLNNTFYQDSFFSSIEKYKFFIIHEYLTDNEDERNFILTWYSCL